MAVIFLTHAMHWLWRAITKIGLSWIMLVFRARMIRNETLIACGKMMSHASIRVLLVAQARNPWEDLYIKNKWWQETAWRSNLMLTNMTCRALSRLWGTVMAQVPLHCEPTMGWCSSGKTKPSERNKGTLLTQLWQMLTLTFDSLKIITAWGSLRNYRVLYSRKNIYLYCLAPRFLLAEEVLQQSRWSFKPSHIFVALKI